MESAEAVESVDDLLVDQASVIVEAFDAVGTSVEVESGFLVHSVEEVVRSDLPSHQIDSVVQRVGYQVQSKMLVVMLKYKSN